MPYYQPGRYWGKVISAELGETSKGNPQVVIHFNVMGRINPDDPEGALLTCERNDRTIYSVISEKRAEWAIRDLRAIGYTAATFRYLDKDDRDYQSLQGNEFPCECVHESYEGRTREKWSVSSGTGMAQVKPLEKAEIRKLDALYGKQLKESAPSQPENTAYSQPAPAGAAPAAASTGADIPW